MTSVPPTDGPTTRLRLDVAYDGTGFAGWSTQPGLRTVQGELEAALATVFGRVGPAPWLTVAGRTDAGVHASGQVAHVDLTPAQVAVLERRRGGAAAVDPIGALAARLDGLASRTHEIVVRRTSLAPPGFDARFGAVWRRYEYRIADPASVHDPRRREHTLWHGRPLDVDLMAAVAEGLVGLHDWAAYCKAREGATTIRELQAFTWRRDDEGVLVGSLQADAFCHNLVRNLVGACVAAGQGVLPVGRPAELRDEARRGSEFTVVPPVGLTLTEIGYPPDDELAARAERTRARRDREDASGRP